MTDAETPLVALLSLWENEARALVDAVRPEPHPEGVLPQNVVDRRNDALRRLRWTMIPRETRKQRFLWPQLRLHLDGGPEAISELAERKQVFERELVRLRWADERSRLFDVQLGVLIDEVGAYVRFEQQWLPQIATRVPAADQERVLGELTAKGGWLPVQPHPDIPASPAVAMITKPFAAVLDRVRDRLSTAPG
jgi:hypothetical protein